MAISTIANLPVGVSDARPAVPGRRPECHAGTTPVWPGLAPVRLRGTARPWSSPHRRRIGRKANRARACTPTCGFNIPATETTGVGARTTRDNQVDKCDHYPARTPVRATARDGDHRATGTRRGVRPAGRPCRTRGIGRVRAGLDTSSHIPLGWSDQRKKHRRALSPNFARRGEKRTRAAPPAFTDRSIVAQQSVARQSTPAMLPLTDRQSTVLNAIRDINARQGYPPSLRQIGEAVGLTSLNTVRFHLGRLEAKGYVSRDPGKPRALRVIDRSPDA